MMSCAAGSTEKTLWIVHLTCGSLILGLTPHLLMLPYIKVPLNTQWRVFGHSVKQVDQLLVDGGYTNDPDAKCGKPCLHCTASLQPSE
jgi:hypothetical protein